MRSLDISFSEGSFQVLRVQKYRSFVSVFSWGKELSCHLLELRSSKGSHRMEVTHGHVLSSVEKVVKADGGSVLPPL